MVFVCGFNKIHSIFVVCLPFVAVGGVDAAAAAAAASIAFETLVFHCNEHKNYSYRFFCILTHSLCISVEKEMLKATASMENRILCESRDYRSW